VVSGPARVIDGDTLELAGERIRLHGIDAPERDQTCGATGGGIWACGVWSGAELVALVQTRDVQCRGTTRDRYGRLVATCRVEGQDIGAEMVRRGAALAYRKYALDYVGAEREAVAAARGIWQGDVVAPETHRRSVAQASAPTSDTGCQIKGNISQSGRIYHLPGQRDYQRTKISERKGERWFCTEDQARDAGWRRARR
jgi:endonuclease YncB( thermonuclease family)